MTRGTDAQRTPGASPPAVLPTQLLFEAGRTVLMPVGGSAYGMPVGPKALAGRYWGNGTPSALQMEQAIDEVEMALMSERLVPGVPRRLVSADPLLCALPGMQRTSEGLSRDAVEVLFNALVAMAEAGRSTAAGLSTTGEAAAALLILRECMHHLNFETIVALEPGGH